MSANGAKADGLALPMSKRTARHRLRDGQRFRPPIAPHCCPIRTPSPPYCCPIGSPGDTIAPAVFRSGTRLPKLLDEQCAGRSGKWTFRTGPVRVMALLRAADLTPEIRYRAITKSGSR